MLQDFPLIARKNKELLSFFPQSYRDWNISSGAPAEAQGSSVNPIPSHVSPFPADSSAPLPAQTCPAGLPVLLSVCLFRKEIPGPVPTAAGAIWGNCELKHPYNSCSVQALSCSVRSPTLLCVFPLLPKSDQADNTRQSSGSGHFIFPKLAISKAKWGNSWVEMQSTHWVVKDLLWRFPV